MKCSTCRNYGCMWYSDPDIQGCEEGELDANAKALGAFDVNAVGGMKEKVGKIDWSLIPLDKVEEVIKYGANKYGMENWTLVDKDEYAKAAFRHVFKLIYHGPTDEESGLEHAAMAVTDLLYWLHLSAEEAKGDKEQVSGVKGKDV